VREKARKSNAGAKPIDVVLMFKILGSSRKCVPDLKSEKGHAFCFLGFFKESEKAEKACPRAYCITVLGSPDAASIMSIVVSRREKRFSESEKTPRPLSVPFVGAGR
jgi:hypothetical protein